MSRFSRCSKSRRRRALAPMRASRERRWSRFLAVGIVAVFSLVLAAGAAAYRSFARLPN